MWNKVQANLLKLYMCGGCCVPGKPTVLPYVSPQDHHPSTNTHEHTPWPSEWPLAIDECSIWAAGALSKWASACGCKISPLLEDVLDRKRCGRKRPGLKEECVKATTAGRGAIYYLQEIAEFRCPVALGSTTQSRCCFYSEFSRTSATSTSFKIPNQRSFMVCRAFFFKYLGNSDPYIWKPSYFI